MTSNLRSLDEADRLNASETILLYEKYISPGQVALLKNHQNFLAHNA